MGHDLPNIYVGRYGVTVLNNINIDYRINPFLVVHFKKCFLDLFVLYGFIKYSLLQDQK